MEEQFNRNLKVMQAKGILISCLKEACGMETSN